MSLLERERGRAGHWEQESSQLEFNWPVVCVSVCERACTGKGLQPWEILWSGSSKWETGIQG